MSTTVEVRGLTRVHGTQTALADVNLHVPAGTCLGVLGPSGSGKSTLLRLVAGLDTPSSGTVHLGGVDHTATPAEQRGAVLVSQRPLLFPHLTVLDNVAFALRIRGSSRRTARAAAAEHLDVVQLGALASRRVSQLSGGQAQRVALARGLAASPRVLLLDEPFSALDSVLREEMQQLLHRIRDAVAPTVVLVTHDHREAAALSDNLAVLHEGQLLQHSTVTEVFTRPATPRVHRITGGRNQIRGTTRAGVHHSALGALVLPPHPQGTHPDGPAWLLLRHEDLTVAMDSAGGSTVVIERRDFGARSLLTIRVGEGTQEAVLYAEVPGHFQARPGTAVRVTIPTNGRWTSSIAPASPVSERLLEPNP